MFPEQLRPPVADARRAGQRMTDQNRVVATLIQTAVDRIMQIDRPQRPARFKVERLNFGKGEIAFVSRLDRFKHIHRLTIEEKNCKAMYRRLSKSEQVNWESRSRGFSR